MKNSIQLTSFYFIVSFFFLFISFGKKIHAQDCTLPQASKVLHGNKISANILNGGDLFWDRSDAIFFSDNNQNPSVASIFNAGLWMGGFTDISNNTPSLKLSASTYPNGNNKDYSAGPLNDSGVTNNDMCINFDRLWEVFGFEIAEHIADFSDDGIVDIKHTNIYAYPAHQNPFFNDFHSFDLPISPQGLAPFHDHDGDGIYNPDNGDYPLPSSVNKDNFPEHLIWGIFNDSGSNHTNSQAETMQFEIQLTAWAFSCTDNEILNNTIFTSHKIINRNQKSFDSLHVGTFVDFDLGCFSDDFVGCIPSMNTFYSYNSDAVDGANCNASVPSFGNNPPVQAVTYLSHEMHSFLTTAPSQSPIGSSPALPTEFYNLLTGQWTDGTPLTQGGNGFNSGGSPTNFIFDGNPNELEEWSMISENIPNGDFRGIGSINIDQFASGQVVEMDMAYTFYQDENLNHIETVNLVYDNTPLLQHLYDNRFQMGCSFSTAIEEPSAKENLFDIFPNPTTHLLNIKLENPQSAAFDIFDIYGKKVFEKSESFNSDFQLPLEDLVEGVYFLKMKMDGEEVVHKFIKI